MTDGSLRTEVKIPSPSLPDSVAVAVPHLGNHKRIGHASASETLSPPSHTKGKESVKYAFGS